jgi:hypothetical protein
MTLAANLADLYRMGYENLPYLADHFEAARVDTWEMRESPFPFQRPDGIGSGGGLGPWSAYASLTHELHDVLSEESRNLRAMGRAVVDCARAYAHMDENAKTEFDNKVAKLDGVPDSV